MTYTGIEPGAARLYLPSQPRRAAGM